MGSLWTPGGEHFPKKEPDEEERGGAQPPSGTRGGGPSGGSGSGGDDAASQAEAQAAVEAMRAQLANTPAEIVVANHCYGLFELAAIYLSQSPPMLFEARLAIDGLGYLLNGLQGRLGDAEPSLQESLSQLRLAYVQLEGVERSASENAAAHTGADTGDGQARVNAEADTADGGGGGGGGGGGSGADGGTD
jgi:hypothetical protein